MASSGTLRACAGLQAVFHGAVQPYEAPGAPAHCEKGAEQWQGLTAGHTALPCGCLVGGMCPWGVVPPPSQSSQCSGWATWLFCSLFGLGLCLKPSDMNGKAQQRLMARCWGCSPLIACCLQEPSILGPSAPSLCPHGDGDRPSQGHSAAPCCSLPRSSSAAHTASLPQHQSSSFSQLRGLQHCALCCADGVSTPCACAKVSMQASHCGHRGVCVQPVL